MNAMTPRPASTLVLLRVTGGRMETLMIKRQAALFWAGWWVFPGGSLEPADHRPENRELVVGTAPAEDIPWIAAALRETAEEVGLYITQPGALPPRGESDDVYGWLRRSGARLDGERAVLLSNWVTPAGVRKRFDTRFYVAEWTGSGEPRPDAAEVAEAEWVAPAVMLGRERADYPLIQPTFETLELLARFDSPQAVMEFARGREVAPVHPPLEWSPPSPRRAAGAEG